MTRPIYWALGVLATVGLIGVSTSGRLSNTLGLGGANQTRKVSAPAQPAPSNSGRILVLHADLRGHYIAHANVNGHTIRTMVDTGATVVALTAADAAKVGANKARKLRVAQFSTANGVVTGSIVRLEEIRIGDIVVRDVEAAIMPPGALSVTLLGMSFLRGLGGFEVSQGRLTMRG